MAHQDSRRDDGGCVQSMSHRQRSAAIDVVSPRRLNAPSASSGAGFVDLAKLQQPVAASEAGSSSAGHTVPAGIGASSSARRPPGGPGGGRGGGRGRGPCSRFPPHHSASVPPVQNAAAIQAHHSSVMAVLMQDAPSMPLELAANVSGVGAAALAAARETLLAEVRRCVTDVGRNWLNKSGQNLRQVNAFSRQAENHVSMWPIKHDTAPRSILSLPIIVTASNSLMSRPLFVMLLSTRSTSNGRNTTTTSGPMSLICLTWATRGRRKSSVKHSTEPRGLYKYRATSTLSNKGAASTERIAVYHAAVLDARQAARLMNVHVSRSCYRICDRSGVACISGLLSCEASFAPRARMWLSRPMRSQRPLQDLRHVRGGV